MQIMSKKNKLDKFIELITYGWRPYEGQATGAVYDNLSCSQRKKARWLAKANKVLCIGCDRACCLQAPRGFQLPLFKYPKSKQKAYLLPPHELVKRKALLTVNESAYILNVSDRQIRRWLAEGRLRVTKISPQRIPAEDVNRLLNGVDWWE